jgi:hypothetical protein
MLPTTGSTMIAAISWPFSRTSWFSTVRSLYGTTKVSLATWREMPGDVRVPPVSSPLPAETSTLSLCP